MNIMVEIRLIWIGKERFAHENMQKPRRFLHRGLINSVGQCFERSNVPGLMARGEETTAR